MERLNDVKIIGNVGSLDLGEKHTHLSIAINESYKPKDSEEWVDKTAWINVVMFGMSKDKVEKQGIQKGDTILIMGKLDSSEYEGKQRTQIIANKIQLIKKSTNNTQAETAAFDYSLMLDPVAKSVTQTNGNSEPAPPTSEALPSEVPPSTDKKDDDLPF